MNNKNLGNTSINNQSKLPFSQACENNQQPILSVLQKELVGYSQVLEVGSGTGQHSVYFAPNLPHLNWQTSDVVTNHAAIKAWHDAHPASNLYKPLAFDLTTDSIPMNLNSKSSINFNDKPYDAVFTANTLHIIPWNLVERLFELVGGILPNSGKFIVYGPFNDDGFYTSEGNRQFDKALRERHTGSGIRDKENVVELAEKNQLTLAKVYPMPANNQLFIFKKIASV